MILNYKTHIITFIIFFNLSISFAQNKSLNIQHYKISDGLSQNYTTDICRDKLGYIWIGTQDGLNRFDGYEFKIYKQNPSDKNSLSDNYIIDLFPGSDSTLWIVNNNGLDLYDCKTDKFQNIIKNKQSKNSVYSTNIKAVIRDEDGIVWMRTIKGIIEYNPANNNFYEYKIQKNGKDVEAGVYEVFKIADDGKNLWMGSSEGLIKFNKKNKNIKFFPISNSQNADNSVYGVFIDHSDKIWVFSDKQIYIFNPDKEQFVKIKTDIDFNQIQSLYVDKSGHVEIGTINGLYTNKGNKFLKLALEDYIYDEVNVGNILNIIEDESDILWVSSDFGIFKIDYKKTNFELYRKDKNNHIELSSNTIYSIYHDVLKDELWLGTLGYGINIFSRKTGKVKYLNSHNSKLSGDKVYCIVKSPDKNLWIGTDLGVVVWSAADRKLIPFNNYQFKDITNLFINNRLNSILFDNDIIWFGTYKGLYKFSKNGIKIYTKKESKNSIVDNQVFKIIKTGKNEYWIATLFGLSKFNSETETFTNYTRDNNKISNNIVPTVFQSSDSTIWAGTGTGLNKYIPEKDSFVYYTSQSHGFSNDFIYTIVEDEKKNLWLSTNRGIIKFNPLTEEVNNFTPDDNLQGYEFNVGAVYKDEKNEIFWGGVKGVNSLKLNKIHKNDYTPQPIITHFFKHTKKGIEEIYIGNKKFIKLSYNENNFDIRFAVPDYTYPLKNKFKYRIKESGNEWTDLGSNNYINFFQLAPGRYTFQLIGANSDNNWNLKPTELVIEISTPWWQTTFAYIFYTLIFLFVIGGGFLVYNKEIRKENRILHEKQIVAKEVEKQKELLAVKNNNIAESMRYASGIINALLPTKEQIRKIIADSFVLFMSKEIVSGDFYWFEETEDKVFIAAVDCTGHGVPGAFMSIIGLDLLRNILESGVNTPAKILDHLNRGIYNMFRNEDQGHTLKDGMDISLIAIHKNEKVVEFAGAMSQMYLIKDDKITEIKGDRFSVSPINYLNYGSFTNNVINVEEGDMIYLFSDGYVDQFGGPDEKKFKYRRFRHLLLNNYERPLNEQKDILKRVINTWRGALEQIDDILVIGVRITDDI